MKSPPIKSRELVEKDFIRAAYQLLKKDATDRDEAQVLRPGHLTALTGSLTQRRKRYTSGLGDSFSETTPERKEQLRQQMLEYCKIDTLPHGSDMVFLKDS